VIRRLWTFCTRSGSPSRRVLLHSVSTPIIPTPDHLFNIVTEVGATVGALGVAAGAFIAARYGRRASVSVSAEAYITPVGVVLATRPVVRAVGIFPVRFHGTRGVLVGVTEVKRGDDGKLVTGQTWEQVEAFGPEHVEPGEELPTTVLFQVGPLTESIIGWRIDLGVQAPTRFLASSSAWADQIFVPRPKVRR